MKYHSYEITLAIGHDCTFEQKTFWGNENSYRDPEIRYKEATGKIIANDTGDIACVIEPAPFHSITVDIGRIIEIPFIDQLRKNPIYKLIDNHFPNHYMIISHINNINHRTGYVTVSHPSSNTIIQQIV